MRKGTRASLFRRCTSWSSNDSMQQQHLQTKKKKQKRKKAVVAKRKLQASDSGDEQEMFEFQGKQYTNYQEYVSAKRAYNQDFMRTQGLLEASKEVFYTTTPIKKNINTKKRHRVTPDGEQDDRRRKSRRLIKKQQQKNGEGEEPNDDNDKDLLEQLKDDESELEQELGGRPVPRRIVRPNIPPMEGEPSWIGGMEVWLSGEVSYKNCSNVMRQVRLLASGSGVDYKHWPAGATFGKDLKVDLSCDFEQLHDQAWKHEQTYGKDLGNGWLLLHPIKKLNLYKQFLAEMKEKK